MVSERFVLESVCRHETLKVVILGYGNLGVAIARELLDLHEVRGPTVVGIQKNACDVTDASQVMRVVAELSPDVVVNCAAITNVAWCERFPSKAVATNAIGAGNVATALLGTDVRLWHISTDYVFKGSHEASTSDIPYPISAYGYSKHLGELAVRAIRPEARIVRLGWLYGVQYKASAPMLAATSRQARIYRDIRGHPTYVRDAARAIAEHIVLNVGEQRLIHLSPGGTPISWFEFLVDQFPSITGAKSEWRATRPVNGGLVPTYGWVLPSYKDGLKRFVDELKTQGPSHER